MASSGKGTSNAAGISKKVDDTNEMLSALKIGEKNIKHAAHISVPPELGTDESTTNPIAGPSSCSSSTLISGPGIGPLGKAGAPAARTLKVTERPTVVILIGMAGAGKTTLAQRFAATLIAEGRNPYIMNLDPACLDPPYPVNIDIRDTINYKQVMESYHLGPNGAIVTALNLFCTKFNAIIDILLSKPLTSKDFILVDTPGQIEVFMWSASGQIILQSFGAMFPTVILYVSDLTTNINPITFMSNMTYACSILYKSKLPLVITLNKCDIKVKIKPNPKFPKREQEEEDQMEVEETKQDNSDIESGNTEEQEEAPGTTYAEQWITDFEAYQEALGGFDSYSTNLASSLSLAMDEFYSHNEYASVSALTGNGMDRLFKSIGKSLVEYESVYLPMMERQAQLQEKERRKRAGKTAADHKQQLKDLAKQMTRNVPFKKSKFAREQERDSPPEPSLFSMPATTGAAQGFSLSLGMDFDDEDTSSGSEGEEVRELESDDNEEDKESFRQFFDKEIKKRDDKHHPGPGPSSSK